MNAQYLEKFQTCVSVVEQYGGNIRRNTGALKVELKAAGITDFSNVAVEDKLAAQ
jgi:hypothetical protein